MKRKVLCFIVAALMVLSMLPMGAIAAEVQKARPAARIESLAKPVEALKAPEAKKAPSYPTRAEHTLYSWGFETDQEGWQFIDKDGDGKNWSRYYGGSSYAHNSSYAIRSGSYDGGDRTPNNWAITPSVTLPEVEAAYLRFWLKGVSTSWRETYGIFVGTSADPDEMTQLGSDMQTSATTTNYEQIEIDISKYIGQTIYIAIVNHHCTGQFMMYVDDVSIVVDDGAPAAPTPTPTPEPTAVPAGYLDDAMNAADTDFVISFTSDDTYPWIVMTDEADRVYAMSGNKGVHSTSSTATATFTLDAPAILSFDYKAWGEGSGNYIWDKCIFKLDGAEIFSKGAENQPWQTYTVETPLEAGEHTIEFTFTKDVSTNGSGDYFKVDNVKLTDASSITPTPEPTPIPDGDDTYYLTDTLEVGKEYLIVNSNQIGDASALIAPDASTLGVGGVTVSSEDGYTLIHSYVTNAFIWKAEAKSGGGILLKNLNANKYLDSYGGLNLWGSASSAYAVTYSNYVLKSGSAVVYWNGTAFAASASGSGNIYLYEKTDGNPPATPTPTPEPTPIPENYIKGYYFETEEELDDWSVVDADGDGENWQWITNANFEPFEGNGILGSASWSNAAILYPDNYAIVGPIQLRNAENELTFYAAGFGENYCEEHFEVLIGLTDDIADMEVLIEETVATASYVQYSASLDDYACEEIYIAFRHFNCYDENWLRLDQVEFWGVIVPPPEFVVEKSVKLEENGTYTFTLEAYATVPGFGTDKSLRGFINEDNFVIDDELDCSVFTYDCIGKNMRGFLFADEGEDVTDAVGKVLNDPYAYEVFGFDFGANYCSAEDESAISGKKLVVECRGIRLSDEVEPGDISTDGNIENGVYYYASGELGELIAIAEPVNVKVGKLDAICSFGAPFMFGGVSVEPIENGYPEYTNSGAGYEYSTALSGGISVAVTDSTIVFTPEGAGSGIIAMNALLCEDGEFEWTRITLLPSTVVLYEEEIGAYTDADFSGDSGKWSSVGEAMVLDPSEIGVFGYDAIYADSIGDSNGTAKGVTVDKALYDAVKSGEAAWPYAEFSFTGTGADLLTRVGENSGIIAIDLVPSGEAYSYTGEGSAHILIDTYYPGYTLYQVPVMHVDDLAYGTYMIRIRAFYMPFADHQGVSETSFAAFPGLENVDYEFTRACNCVREAGRVHGSFETYVDGLRVYNPIDTAANEAAASAYAIFGELDPIFKNVRVMLDSEDALLLDIDSGSATPADYDEISPRYEVYLRPDKSVAFGIDGEYSAIHLSLKSPTGESFKVKINGEYLCDENGDAIVIAHTSELYYDITPYVTAVVGGCSVSVTCEAVDGSDSMLSVVTVKLLPAGSDTLPSIVSGADLIGFVEAIHFGVMGDADRDGAVTVMDALTVMRSVLGSVELGSYGSICADVDGSGTVNVLDALAIIRIALGII